MAELKIQPMSPSAQGARFLEFRGLFPAIFKQFVIA